MSLVFHPQTEQQITQFLTHPTHALLIVGAAGSGKESLANYLTTRLLGLNDMQKPQDYAYFKSIEPEKDKTSIGIEAIRDLQPFVKLKLPANSRDWRITLIHNAHELTIEAQNALLKLLEEPPQQTIFLLTTDSVERLLPTIRSRTQQLHIILPTSEAILRHFSAHYDEAVVKQAYMVSGGLPGLTAAILEDADDHPLKAAVQTAKELLRATQFERPCRVDELAKKKPETLHVIFVLQHMARAALAQAAQTADGSTTKRIKQWHRVQKAAYEAEQAYAVSAQAKLTLTKLMLSL